MHAVWKYELRLMDEPIGLMIPIMAELLFVGIEPSFAHNANDAPITASHKLRLWARVNPEAPMEERKLQVFGTGHKRIPEGAVHVESVLCPPYIWHVFEVK